MEFASTAFWLAALEIVVINILLSGDNAVVIALACRNLPGRMRTWGILLGAAGAIVLRIVLTFFAVTLLGLPWLKLLGGVLLLWIGVKLVADEDADGGDGEAKVAASDRLWAAVLTVVVADLVMSIAQVAGAVTGSFARLRACRAVKLRRLIAPPFDCPPA